MVDRVRVLVVDDERPLADLYTAWLGDEYDVDVAYGGEEALEVIDADVDVVLLDRRMPRLSGDEVLDRIRERGLGCRVAMVTAVDPGVDILEMPFEDYLTKPVSRADLEATIDRLNRLATYDDAVQEYFSLVSKRAAIEADRSSDAYRSSDEYQALLEEIERLEGELDEALEELDDVEFGTLFSGT